MRIHTRSRSRTMPISPALRSHIVRRLHFSLAPVVGRTPRVLVWVGDENGPRGGEDKYCCIRADLDGHRPVFVRDRHEDLYAAISLAAGRIGRAVQRAVRRQERFSRTRRPAPVQDLPH
jgi:ribosome-associated translation inhibitor RaiA